jgi:hypothetical protein
MVLIVKKKLTPKNRIMEHKAELLNTKKLLGDKKESRRKITGE